jgi:hypothetical protein
MADDTNTADDADLLAVMARAHQQQDEFVRQNLNLDRALRSGQVRSAILDIKRQIDAAMPAYEEAPEVTNERRSAEAERSGISDEFRAVVSEDVAAINRTQAG